MQDNIIKTISFEQEEIIKNIISLHTGKIELDATYSKGNFYNKTGIEKPSHKFDLFPQSKEVKKANANKIPLAASSISCIMFDPPFLAGNTNGKNTGKMITRFTGFRYVPDLWKWYTECLTEFHRILKPKGHLIFKCQDTVSSGKQWFSHNYIMNEAEKIGYYNKDIFILLAKSRLIGHNHSIQKHARKFHSYFLVLQKQKQD